MKSKDLLWKGIIEECYDKNKLNSLFIFMNYYLSFDNIEENMNIATKKKNIVLIFGIIFPHQLKVGI